MSLFSLMFGKDKVTETLEEAISRGVVHMEKTDHKRQHKRKQQKKGTVSNTRYMNLSLEESNALRTTCITQLKKMFAQAETGAVVTGCSYKKIQKFLNVGIYEINQYRTIAFDRADGTPLIIEEKAGKIVWVKELNYDKLSRFLADLVKLLEHPNAKWFVRTTTYHNYTIEALQEITNSNWREYILPIKDSYADIHTEAEGKLCDTTKDDLFTVRHSYLANYQGKVYHADSIISDYVVNLLDEDGKFFFVDLRDLTDFRQKEYYIEVKGHWFKADRIGRDILTVMEQKNVYYKSLGFTAIHPYDGGGWEITRDQIDAVQYNTVSIYDRIITMLKNRDIQ